MNRVEALSLRVEALERELAEARVREVRCRESETWLQVAADVCGLGLWRWEVSTDSITWDARLRSIFGRDRAPADMGEWRSWLHPDDSERIVAHVSEALRTGVYPEVEHRIVRSDGSVRWIHASAAVEHDTLGRAVAMMGAVFDVTERRDLESRARHVTKMEALARLASGVAHNFNNILAVMMPSLDEASRISPEAYGALTPARDAARQAADIVQELSRISGDETRVRTRGDLVSVLRRVLVDCYRAFGDEIEWEVEIDGSLPLVAVDAQRFERALINVLTNAREALRTPEERAPKIAVQARSEGSNVAVSISDTGSGMDEETRARLFEPFFTTKGPTGGAGLGLATSYAIVRAHGGTIECAPRTGGGTTVTITLPTRATARHSVAPRERPDTLRGRGERVLVADDERLLRRVLHSLLEGSGYVVVEAVDGIEAIETLTADPKIDLVILDRSMPLMSGAEVMRWITRERPSLRVIGYSGLDEPLAGVRAMLTKPVEPDALLATVRAVLDGP